ncbi:hypothetical protein [Terrisporobacter sp.]|uniref:phage lytic cycle repressor MrpR family protein n=1 Tax=Terrisporobacter sp. TaxID=1965305 RepID=UPI00399373CD
MKKYKMTKDQIRILERIYTTLQQYFGDKPIKDLGEEELKKYCKLYWCNDVTVATARGYLLYVNEVLKNEGNPYKMHVEDFNCKIIRHGYITKKELDQCINDLENPQDQFIIYALFEGIMGDKFEELRFLKKNQVDLKKRTIDLGDRTIRMNVEFTEIIASALEQHEYYLINFRDGAKVTTYDLNEYSEFVLKSRKTKNTLDGLAPFGYEGLRARVKRINAFLGMEFTPDTLIKSGYAYKLYKKFDGNINSTKVDNFIKKNKLKVSLSNMMNIYDFTYGK